MHHPGPPRFTSVGESIELAPRDPDPGGTYEWSIERRPEGSELTVPDDPVVYVVPDEPGVYRLRLRGPDETYAQLVRAFPDERRTARFAISRDDLDAETVSIVSTFNGWRPGETRPELSGDEWVFETELPPGSYPYSFLPDDDFEAGVGGELVVPGPGRPRITLDATVEDGVARVTATVEAAPDSDLDDGGVDVEFYLDGRDRTPEGTNRGGRSLDVPLGEVDDRLRVHAVAHGERRSVGETLTVESDGVAKPDAPPSWIEGATVYEIFVRSFAGGRLETTFGELERRIPYLEWLGVDAVWLTPVLESPTEHGYHVTDYFDTATDLGSREEFESLVEACHDAGIRVIFDLVINHSGVEHPHFQMGAAGHPAYRDRYVWEDGEADHYFNWSSIPNFDFGSLDVRRHHLDVIDEWVDLVDGFRADVAWGVPHGFWKEVRSRARERDPGFLMLDETVPNDPLFGENEFGVHHDTDLFGALRAIGAGEESGEALLDAIDEGVRRGFPSRDVMLRYVENHDEERYLAECGREALVAATAATFTVPGAPMIYYGQEQGMTEYRGDMQWQGGDDELTEIHRRLSELRARSDALRHGDLRRIEWNANSDRVVAFARKTDDEAVLVALNFGSGSCEVRVDANVEPVDLLAEGGVDLTTVEGETVLEVEDVLVLEADL